jgi:hypothetical protein
VQVNQIGVDIDSKYLVVEICRADQASTSAQFDNTDSGHRKFIRWTTRGGERACVCCEFTGVYGE